MMRALIALTALAIPFGSVAAQTLAVDGSGGPLTLAEDVQSAIDAWQAVADPPLALGLSDDGEVPVRFASDLELGPDTLALTLVRQGTESGPAIEIVLAPNRYDLSPATLLHEVGIVLGLTPTTSTTSVMRPAQSELSPSAPSEEDAEALESLRAAVPEDVNRDGRVDFEDLVALAAAFGSQGLNLAADIDGSGRVDRGDLEALRAAYAFDPPDRDPPQPDSPDPVTTPALPEIPDGPTTDEPAPPPNDPSVAPGEDEAPPTDSDESDDGEGG